MDWTLQAEFVRHVEEGLRQRQRRRYYAAGSHYVSRAHCPFDITIAPINRELF
jgi:hypothetical protein